MQRETVKEISHRTNGNARAVDNVVAQVSQPAVSQCFQPADVANSSPTSDLGHAADWKSAIQQVVKPALRYRRAPPRRAGRRQNVARGRHLAGSKPAIQQRYSRLQVCATGAANT